MSVKRTSRSHPGCKYILVFGISTILSSAMAIEGASSCGPSTKDCTSSLIPPLLWTRPTSTRTRANTSSSASCHKTFQFTYRSRSKFVSILSGKDHPDILPQLSAPERHFRTTMILMNWAGRSSSLLLRTN